MLRLFYPILATIVVILGYRCPVEAAQATPVKSINVQNVVFHGNHTFTDQQLQTIIQPWLGHPIPFEDLLQIREAITQHYVNSGYITSFALLPVADNQVVNTDTATITIQIVEGKLGNIQVEKAPRLAAQIQRKLRSHRIFNQAELLNQLQFLRLDPAIRELQAELLPGDEPGLNNLRVQIAPAPTFTVSTGMNNHHSIDTGNYEQTLQFNWHNPLGFGDTLTTNMAHTQGSNNWQVIYHAPIDATGKTKVGLEYRNSSNRVIRPPFDQVDIHTKSSALDLSFERTIFQTFQVDTFKVLNVEAMVADVYDRAYLLGQPFPLSLESDPQGRIHLNVLRLSQDYQQRNRHSAFALYSRFNIGLGGYGGSANGVDGKFVSWQGQALFNQSTRWGELTLRGYAQLSGDALPSYEQISLGGATTVRGYRVDAGLGDNGLLGSVELKIPLLRQPAQGLFAIPFMDVGMTWNQRAASQSLGSSGLGLQYQLGGLSVRLNYAIPFIHSSDRQSWQDHQFDFSARYTHSF